MYAASVEKEAIGSHVVKVAVFAIVSTLGGTAVGGTVGAGGWVFCGNAGVVGVAVGVGPHALRLSTATSSKVKNTDFLFITCSSRIERMERIGYE